MAEEGHTTDPTVLTTQQLVREIAALKASSNSDVVALREIIFTRLEAMDKAVDLLQAKADRSPTIGEMQERFDGLRSLLAEMDKRYQAEFVKLSTTTEMMVQQQALALSATKEAVALAMDAAEKAVTKAEVAAEKRFASINEFRAQLADQQATFARSDLVSQRADSLENKLDTVARGFEGRLHDTKDYINSVKENIASLENRIKGASLLWGFLLGGAGLLAVLAGFIAMIG